MPPPKFGLALSFQVHQGLGEPWDKAYREGIELAAEANRLGFDSIWVSEHHGEADGYCPSPVVACAALAVAAPDCRIGQAVALAPLHGHPLRLAEDLSVLDNLSGGRVEIGLGQGYRPAEFEMFGWPYARRTTAFEESLDILGLAWRGERFDYEGRVYKVKGGLLRPPPIKPGPPPLWIGAAAPVARAGRAPARRPSGRATDRARTPGAPDQVVRRRGSPPERRPLAACADARGDRGRIGRRRDQAAPALSRPRLSCAVRAGTHGPDLDRSGDRRTQAAHRR
jgi:hypothetical protein